MEIEAALKRDIPLIPALVGNTKMPAESELPVSIAMLAYRSAAEVRPGRDLDHHIDNLLKGVRKVAASDISEENNSNNQSARTKREFKKSESIVNSGDASEKNKKSNRLSTKIAYATVLFLFLPLLSWVAWEKYLDSQANAEYQKYKREMSIRFSRVKATVLDRQTNLMWTAEDVHTNEKLDVNWDKGFDHNDAVAYCSDLIFDVKHCSIERSIFARSAIIVMGHLIDSR